MALNVIFFNEQKFIAELNLHKCICSIGTEQGQAKKQALTLFSCFYYSKN